LQVIPGLQGRIVNLEFRSVSYRVSTDKQATAADTRWPMPAKTREPSRNVDEFRAVGIILKFLRAMSMAAAQAFRIPASSNSRCRLMAGG
jgi:hypothetical protein